MNSFKRILALSLAVLILSSFTACQVFKAEEETTKLSMDDLLTATGEDGASVTDFEGNTMVTDAQSEIDEFNQKEEVLSQSGNVSTNVAGTTNKNVVNGTTSATPNNPANVGNQGGTVNQGGVVNQGGAVNQGGVANQGGTVNQSGGINKKPTTTKKNTNNGETVTIPQASYFNTLNQEIFSKGVFTIDGTMSASFDGDSMSLPFKLARNGKEQYVRTQYTYQGITVGLIINNNNPYLLIPTLKLYVEIEESIFGESDYSGLTDVHSYVSTKRVKIGDVIYVCEEIKDSDGYSTFFYFEETTGDLKRIKFQDVDGESLLKVSSIKPTVDKSEFAIPKGYKKTSLDNLG